ncbi:MAG: bacillithiol system protein YtxJ [Marivirga sp.]|jgi:bacillithiol system protein YtxJ
MNWKKLDSIETIEQIKRDSVAHPIVIFKHSTSCSISSMALNRLERSWDDTEMEVAQAYYLDLLSNREISNVLAQQFGVAHQSPQVLIIKDGICIYDNSHMGISYRDIKEEVLA